MNVATRPSIAAISFTAALSMKARSAASSAAECFRLISYCEFMNSWFPAYAWSPSSSAQSRVLRLICRGSETAQAVPTRLVDVAVEPVRRVRSRRQRNHSSSGPTIGRSPRVA